MNLKQKTFFFVAVIVTVLFLGYVVFSNSYIRRQETRFLDERLRLAETVAGEFTGFFTRGVQRLETVASLPGLVYGLQSLEEMGQGRQIPMWTTLHYMFFEHDVFTNGIYLVNGQGKIIWREPPDSNALDEDFAGFSQIVAKLGDPPAEIAFVVSERGDGTEILVGTPIDDGNGKTVGLLVGAIPVSHPAIRTMLTANSTGHGTTQLVDDAGLIIAATDPARQMRTFDYQNPEKPIVVSAHVSPAPWTIVIDQDASEALSGIQGLKILLATYGAVFLLIAMASLLFILRSFTRPVEILTEAARRIGDGDLTGGFALDRRDEIGVLSKTLDDMKTKLKASYDLLLQSEKMALMGQIVAGIAHELNNPLTIVIGNVQLLMMREVNEKNLQSLIRIKDGSERASKIVKNLLTFARQDKPERKLTNINTVLKKALELRAYELKVSNVEAHTDLDPNLPETMADSHQLQQVFLNLIVNAEHAMLAAHGKGLLRMTTRTEGNRILVFFSDDGPGIPQDNLRRIFEPFFTTKPVGKGTGLGLSICQGIIGEHGGRIDVESTVGRGATFVVDIPTARIEVVAGRRSR